MYLKRTTIAMDFETEDFFRYVSEADPFNGRKTRSEVVLMLVRHYKNTTDEFIMKGFRDEDIEKLKAMDTKYNDPGIGAGNLIEFIEENKGVAKKLMKWVRK